MKRTWIFCTLVSILLCSSFTASKTQKTTRPMKQRSKTDLTILAEEFNDKVKFQKLLNPLLVERIPGTKTHRQVGDFIIKTMQDLKWTVTIDEFTGNTPKGQKQFRNIIATYNPDLPKRLVLAAHYDSKMLFNSRNEPVPFIGMTDSSVPCAILLDVATQLTCTLNEMKPNEHKSASDISLELVFFDGEEAFETWTETDSLYGSRHLATKWKNTPHPTSPDKNYLDSIDLFVLLDLIGSTDVNFHSFFGNTDNYFSALVNLEVKMDKENLLVKRKRFQTLFTNHRYMIGQHGIEDDHIPFIKAKQAFPVLHLISYPFPSVWHKTYDNKDAYDADVTENFNRVFRVFVANFLHLDAKIANCRRIRR